MWPDPGTLPPPDHDPTLHPPEPRLTKPSATGTMVSPKVYVVVWKGDDALGQQMVTFTDFFIKSSFWTTAMAEYGVKAGQGATLVVLDEAPPAKIEILFPGFSPLVTEALKKAGVTADKNTLVSFIIDPKTSVTQLGQPGSCVAFGGFHQATSANVAYTVAALCPGADGNPDYNDLTVSQSHEIEEAASDPTPQSNPINSAANIPGGGEIGDNCLNVNYALTDTTIPKTYSVQRVYSDVNAGKNNVDPCLVNDGPFFGTGIWGGNTSNESVVTVNRTNNVGSATFTLQPFSYDSSVDEVEFSIVGSLLPAGVTVTPDIARRADPNNPSGVLGMRAFGKPGSTMQITVNVDATYQPSGQGDPNLVVFSRIKSGQISVWCGTISIN
jgi:hypothetical protein